MPNIVEGEPGIFPDPVARVLRGIGGLFRRRDRTEHAAPEPPTEGGPPTGPATDEAAPTDASTTTADPATGPTTDEPAPTDASTTTNPAADEPAPTDADTTTGPAATHEPAPTDASTTTGPAADEPPPTDASTNPPAGDDRGASD